ncbi:unnamed protein product [marine sediment metagenome]|uniref:Uncharacterized protein n=1 Tax=marine sediment metagenome TaxID=412755 RepID=X0T533_9ZZZZ
MALVKTAIDGTEIEVERDRWVRDVARELGIKIPTLCHHPALEPYGECRLCVVEATKGKWNLADHLLRPAHPRGAMAIDVFLGGRGELPPDHGWAAPSKPNEADAAAPRQPIRTLSRARRKGNFEEIVKSYSRQAACAEARRCLRCDLEI